MYHKSYLLHCDNDNAATSCSGNSQIPLIAATYIAAAWTAVAFTASAVANRCASLSGVMMQPAYPFVTALHGLYNKIKIARKS